MDFPTEIRYNRQLASHDKFSKVLDDILLGNWGGFLSFLVHAAARPPSIARLWRDHTKFHTRVSHISLSPWRSCAWAKSPETFCQSVVNWMTDCLTVRQAAWQKKIVDLLGLFMDFPSSFSFSQKVKFWGLIFQSGPGNRQSTFWKTTAIKSEKVKLLPFCHRTLWPNWSASGNWTNSFYLIHRKRPSKTYLFLIKAVSI